MIKEVFKPGSVKEAVSLKNSDVYYLAGGTEINWSPAVERRRRAGKPSVEKVVLLAGILSTDIKKDSGVISIGAGITLQELKDSPEVPRALSKSAGFIASRNIRNMATLGGNIGANRPDSYLIPCLIALGADVDTEEEGIMCVETYCREEKTALIKRVLIPEMKGVCDVDVSVKSSAAYPSVTAAVRVASGEAVVALGCVAEHVVRLKDVEKGIADGSLRGPELEKAVSGMVNPVSDLAGSSEYKKYLAGTMVAHLVDLAAEEAGV